jgi:plastocyanin
MRQLAFAGVVAALVFATGVPATAAEAVVHQKGKSFDKDSVAINKGDSVKFVNDDSVAHNVHSRSSGGAFDLGVQKPGTSSSHTFASDGTFRVRCAIHPKMKLTVTVK